jgi:predicted ATPase
MEGGSSNLWNQLVSEFSSNFQMLLDILPNVTRLAPSPAASCSYQGNGTSGGADVNFFSLCDIIKRFVRVISATTLPILMVLDDLQWSDSVSLGIFHTVLSGKEGASHLLFVGSYRDNEVREDHILYEFYGWLSAFNVPYSTVHLKGLAKEDVLSLVSDSLGMLPHLSQSLAHAIHRKTEGNPLFVQTFLRSLG